MFDWLCSMFMSSTADAALGAAIYSAGLASTGGMHQMKEPDELQKIASKYKTQHTDN